jgi:hypothetical protein
MQIKYFSDASDDDQKVVKRESHHELHSCYRTHVSDKRRKGLAKHISKMSKAATKVKIQKNKLYLKEDRKKSMNKAKEEKKKPNNQRKQKKFQTLVTDQDQYVRKNVIVIVV